MNKTNIDWPELSYSWNPIVGCKNGCSYCYARKISNRFKMIPDFSKPQLFINRMNEPMKVKKTSTIFVGSMCDIFSKGVDPNWVLDIITIVKECPQHTFMFLTKDPQYYENYKWPDNCYLGATIESYREKWRALEIRNLSNKTFLSIEPILDTLEEVSFKGIDLLIVGADSTPGAPKPKKEWIESIVHPNIWYKESIRKIYPEFKNEVK